MAEGRLGHAEHSGSGRQRTVLLDSVHDPKVDTFNHIIDEQN